GNFCPKGSRWTKVFIEADFKFVTLGFHVPKVCGRRCHAKERGNIPATAGNQNIGAIFVEYIRGYRHKVLEQGEVQAQVLFGSGFPMDIWIADRCFPVEGVRALPVGGIVEPGSRPEGVLRSIQPSPSSAVIAHYANAIPEFECIDPINLEKRLI